MFHYILFLIIFPYFISVKADGAKTDCSSTDANCATHATCAASGGTCSCNTGYIVLTTGLCTGEVER